MKHIHLETWGIPDIAPEVMSRVESAIDVLDDGSGAGSDYLGWVELPENYDQDEFSRIVLAAERVRKSAQVFITIGIGGSYLGARAVIEALTDPFGADGGPEMIYAGHQLSNQYMQDLLAHIEDKDVYINVISKSGTTLEPALAFRVLRSFLEGKYGEEGARERIFVTTDARRGALKDLSERKGYETFVVPDDVGGRYSVLTAVGLLPIAVSGVDIGALMLGARDAMDLYDAPYEDNPCYQYAALRSALYASDKKIEILVGYEPRLQYFNEWWKQLFGESEGKDGGGLYPSSMLFTTDLHSLGQYVQEGERHVFETVISVQNTDNPLIIAEDPDNDDGLNYLRGKSFYDANKAAQEGTREAHLEGGVPQIGIVLPRLDAYHMGELIYFFEKACGVSAYTLGVNPFNQPGVEAYKKKMFALLGKE